MKINEAKNRLNEERDLIYNLIHFYIMQISPVKKTNRPHLKSLLTKKYTPSHHNSTLKSWPDFIENMYRDSHFEDTFTVCKQRFSTAMNFTLVNL